MILALPVGDIPRNFRDGKHFKAHTSFGDIGRTLICETVSRHRQTQHQPKGSRREGGWGRRWPVRPRGLFFHLFSKGKIQDLLFWSCALQECKHVGQRGSDSLGQSLTPLIWGSHRVFFPACSLTYSYFSWSVAFSLPSKSLSPSDKKTVIPWREITEHSW